MRRRGGDKHWSWAKGAVTILNLRTGESYTRWIDSEAIGDEPFIILGEFNRRLDIDGDDVWEEIDDGQPTNADLEKITGDEPQYEPALRLLGDAYVRDNQLQDALDAYRRALASL